jgi:hypothetical protein
MFVFILYSVMNLIVLGNKLGTLADAMSQCHPGLGFADLLSWRNLFRPELHHPKRGGGGRSIIP